MILCYRLCPTPLPVAEAAGGGVIFFALFGRPPKKGLNLAPRPFEGRDRGWGEISEKLTDTQNPSRRFRTRWRCPLDMDGVALGGFSGFHQRLAECGVGVHVARNFGAGQFQALGQGQLGQQFRNIRADQMRA